MFSWVPLRPAPDHFKLELECGRRTLALQLWLMGFVFFWCLLLAHKHICTPKQKNVYLHRDSAHGFIGVKELMGCGQLWESEEQHLSFFFPTEKTATAASRSVAINSYRKSSKDRLQEANWNCVCGGGGGCWGSIIATLRAGWWGTWMHICALSSLEINEQQQTPLAVWLLLTGRNSSQTMMCDYFAVQQIKPRSNLSQVSSQKAVYLDPGSVGGNNYSSKTFYRHQPPVMLSPQWAAAPWNPSFPSHCLPLLNFRFIWLANRVILSLVCLNGKWRYYA